jgi:hypothetical protein
VIALVLAAAALAAQTEPPAPAVESWATLPELAFARPPRDLSDLQSYVRDEVAAGRCRQERAADGSTTVRVQMVVLVDPTGAVLRAVPAAIGCPTVEQYTVGLVQRLARDNLRPPLPAQLTWFRTGLVYSWTP